jgi:hypothetical protein
MVTSKSRQPERNMGKLNAHHAQNATHVGVVEGGLVMKLIKKLLHAQKENNVPLHSLHPTHNFKRKETS